MVIILKWSYVLNGLMEKRSIGRRTTKLSRKSMDLTVVLRGFIHDDLFVLLIICETEGNVVNV